MVFKMFGLIHTLQTPSAYIDVYHVPRPCIHERRRSFTCMSGSSPIGSSSNDVIDESISQIPLQPRVTRRRSISTVVNTNQQNATGQPPSQGIRTPGRGRRPPGRVHSGVMGRGRARRPPSDGVDTVGKRTGLPDRVPKTSDTRQPRYSDRPPPTRYTDEQTVAYVLRGNQMGLVKRLQDLGKQGNYKRALIEIERAEFPLNLFIYNAALTACAKSKKWKEALQLLENMRENVIYPDVRTYTAAIDACSKGGRWEKAVSLLEQMQTIDGVEPDIICYTAVIDALGRGMEPDKAIALLEKMHDKGLEPGIRTYTAALDACNRSGRWIQALDLLRDLRENRNIKPDVKAFTVVCESLAKGGQYQQALAILEDMRATGVEPNEVTYASVICACQKAGNWEKAIALLDEMKTYNVQPETRCFVNVLLACSQGLQWERAVELLEEMRAGGVEPMTITYNVVIGTCTKAGQMEKADDLLAEMQTYGLMPDHVTYTALIDGYAKADNGWERALALLNEMKSRDVGVGDRAATAALVACCKEGQWEPAVKLLRLMDSDEISGKGPSVFCYNSCIDACSKNGQWETALELLETVKAKGMTPDVITYTTAIDACSKGGQPDKAIELLRDMKKEGIVPTVVTYSATMDALSKGGKWREGLELLAEMKKEGIEPDLTIYTTLGDGLQAADEIEKVDELYREVVAKGLRQPIGTSNGKPALTLTRHSVAMALSALRQSLDNMKQKHAQHNNMKNLGNSLNLNVEGVKRSENRASTEGTLQGETFDFDPNDGLIIVTGSISSRGGEGKKLQPAIIKELKRRGILCRAESTVERRISIHAQELLAYVDRVDDYVGVGSEEW